VAAEVKDIEPLESIAWSAAQRLVDCYHRSLRPDWPWFESRMTYANAVLPHALFIAAKRWPQEGKASSWSGQESFAFLDRPHDDRPRAVFWPVGNSDWYPHGEAKAPYDQQPVEAVTMADAALAALGVARRRAIPGDLSPGARLVPRPEQPCTSRSSTSGRGACCDGLQASGVNRNQGAESTLAYLVDGTAARRFNSPQLAAAVLTCSRCLKRA
jgi:hypothetical protein